MSLQQIAERICGLCRCEFLSRTGRNEFYQELRRFVCAGVDAAPTLTPCSSALIAQGAEPGLEVHVCGGVGKSQPLLFAIVQYVSNLPCSRQEWSSSFQQVLQCGLRRIVPADRFQVRLALSACVTRTLD